MNNYPSSERERERQRPLYAPPSMEPTLPPLPSLAMSAASSGTASMSSIMSMTTTTTTATAPVPVSITAPKPVSITVPTLPSSLAVPLAAASEPAPYLADPTEEYFSSMSASARQHPLLSANGFLPQQHHSAPSTSDPYIDVCFPPARACNPEYGSTSFRKNYAYNQSSIRAFSTDSPATLPTIQRPPLPLSAPSPASQLSSSSASSPPLPILSSIKVSFPLVKRPSLPGNNEKSVPIEAQSAESPDNSKLIKVVLVFTNTDILSVCLTPWSNTEVAAERRFVRFTKSLNLNTLSLDASIVSYDERNPTEQTGICPTTGLPYIEISCLRCHCLPESNTNHIDALEEQQLLSYKYYITSIEMIKLIEFIIGTSAETPQDLEAIRKERGRIRSNLVPFWSKWTVNSKSNLDKMHDIKWRYRIEMGERIMAYKYRKPRDFDKEIRVLNWENLEPALHRVLQNYYVQYAT